MVSNSFPGFYIQQGLSVVFIVLHGFVTCICQYFIWLQPVEGAIYEADDAYWIRSNLSCYCLANFSHQQIVHGFCEDF